MTRATIPATQSRKSTKASVPETAGGRPFFWSHPDTRVNRTAMKTEMTRGPKKSENILIPARMMKVQATRRTVLSAPRRPGDSVISVHPYAPEPI